MSTWRGRETRIRHEPTGLTVTSLRGTLDASIDPYGDLAAVLTWLDGYGVTPASLSSMSWNLLRASLSSEVVVGASRRLGSSAFFGPRQEITEPRRYTNLQLADIKAAYATAMSSRPVALSLHEVSPTTVLDPDVPGIARAFVSVPDDLLYPPLPVRVSPEANPSSSSASSRGPGRGAN